VAHHNMKSSVGMFRNMECQKCQNKSFQPMLVPPSWDKTEYQDLVQPIWKRAITELQRATRICVIGYSLPESDAYFKYLLTLGLAENHGLYKFIVIDRGQPTAFFGDQSQETGQKTKTLRERYKELLEDLFQERRFTFRNEGFWHWAQGNSIQRELGRGEMIARI